MDGEELIAGRDEERSAQEEIERLREQMLRLRADFANYRRRTGQHFAEMEQRVRAKVIGSLLPLLDAIEAAAESVPEKQRETRQGLEMLRERARSLLAEQGLERIDETGVQVRPEWHEVVRMAGSEAEEGMIVAVDQTGYRMADKVLRPAKVAVAGPARGDSSEEGDCCDA